MAEKVNIWDGVIYTGKYSSGTDMYTSGTNVVYYIIPLIVGHDYKVKFIESHNRRRIMTTSFDPSQSTGNGVRCLGDTDSPSVPYELDFTAQSNENYLFLYVSNTGQTPAITAHDMSVPDCEEKYLIQSDDTVYTVTDGAVIAVEGSVNAELFRTYGVGEIPSSDLLVTLTDPVVLFWTDATDFEIPSLVAVEKAVPAIPQTLESEDYDMTHSSIVGIEKVLVDASDDVRFAISFDSGQTWYTHTGQAWGILSEADTGMSASIMSAITTEDWNSIATTGKFRFRLTIPSVDSCLNSLVVDYLN